MSSLRQRLTIDQCEQQAREFRPTGMNSTFDLCGPGGTLKCYWLDPYMGLFVMGKADGFNMTHQVRGLDIWCENLQPAVVDNQVESR